MLKMKLIASVMIIVLATALIGGLTGAWFSDADDAGTTTFTAGILSVDVSDGLTELEVFETTNSIYPGDDFGPIEIDIFNDGSKDLAWFGNWTFTQKGQKPDILLDKLYIKTMGVTFYKPDGVTPWNTTDPNYQSGNFIENGVGASTIAAVDAYFDNLATLDPLGSGVITLRQYNDHGYGPLLIGTPFEHMGALKPGYKYVINVEFAFHESADNDYQGNKVAPIKIGFEVDARQVNEVAIQELISTFGPTQMGYLNNEIAQQQ